MYLIKELYPEYIKNTYKLIRRQTSFLERAKYLRHFKKRYRNGN